jgi:hypothetical protein
MRKKLIISVSLVLAIITGVCQSTETNSAYKPKGHGFGAIYSSSNGKGLVYRYLPNKNGFHAAFIPISQTEQKYASLNLTGYHEVFRKNDVRLFLQSGVEWINVTKHEVGTSIISSAPIVNYDVVSTDNAFNASAGLALEVGSEVLKLTAFLGYGAYIKTTNIDDKLKEYAPRKDETLLNLSGGIAIFVVI